MKKEDYKSILSDIDLSDSQRDKILDVIEDLSGRASWYAMMSTSSTGEYYFSGKADGLNAMYRFIAGTMSEHDEFDNTE